MSIEVLIMDNKFLEAIKTYCTIVEDACNLLISYIEGTERIIILNKFDLYNYFNNSRKKEFDIGDKKYYCHGIGMMVIRNDIVITNWNFGCKSWWCGIDPFLMAETLRNSCFKDVDYHDGNFIKYKCEQYVLEKLLYYYKGQYYIDMLKLECKKIKFPTNYDKMVIEYKGITRSFNRCKSIDRFIRKSTTVYAGIQDLKNNYVLVFFNSGIEVARVPYNDIAYPNSAVKIMNGEIIRPHIVDEWKK